MQTLNEDALAHSIAVILGGILLCGLLFAFFTPVVNEISSSFNHFIGNDQVSVQTYDAYSFNLGLFAGIPAITLIVLLIFGVLKAIEIRRGDG